MPIYSFQHTSSSRKAASSQCYFFLKDWGEVQILWISWQCKEWLWIFWCLSLLHLSVPLEFSAAADFFFFFLRISCILLIRNSSWYTPQSKQWNTWGSKIMLKNWKMGIDGLNFPNEHNKCSKRHKRIY